MDNEPMAAPTLSKIQLRASEAACEVSFHYVIDPPHCQVRLYRTPMDMDPLVVNGPAGWGTIVLDEPRTLYFDFVKNEGSFSLYTDGWREPSATDPLILLP
ncbi:hypothetical protein W02_31230 [Nitrospira sp. KM1]|nr:hypothetical protein W02_31230 [Nitrospira sp. KM1]